MEKVFRRLFGVPRCIFLNIVQKAKVEGWFGHYKYTDIQGYPVDVTGKIYLVPLELKILACFKILAKGCSYHDLHDNIDIECWNGENTMRHFFFRFVVDTMVDKLFADYVHLSRNKVELKEITDVYNLLGFPGCAFSMDCVHIRWKNCPYMFIVS